MRVIVFGIFLLTWLLQGHAVAQVASEDLRNALEEYNYFSNGPSTFATVCLPDGCQSAMSGYRQMDHKEQVDSRSLVSIGSNSKYITAILTLMLVDQGYLRLDDKLADYFPEYARWPGVTIRHLISHSSGVPEYLFTQEGLAKTVLSLFNWRTRIWKPEELIQTVINKPADFPPGSKVEYNNTNFVLLGMVDEKVTRLPLDVLLDRYLFGPLGMRDTYLTLPYSETPRRLPGYFPDDFHMPTWLVNVFSRKVKKTGPYIDTTHAFDPSMTWSAGGMVSTTADLAKITVALFSGRLISQNLLAEMKTMRPGTVLGNPFLYGLGLMRRPSRYGDLYGHGGLTPGYEVITEFLPERGAVLVMAQNMGPAQLYAGYSDLLDQIFSGFDPMTFKEDMAISTTRPQRAGIHFRLKGKINDASARPESLNMAIGFADVKISGDEPQPYQIFVARMSQKEGRTFLVLTGASQASLFGAGSARESKTASVEIWIDKEKLMAEESSLVGDGRRGELMFAFKTNVTTPKQGTPTRCISDVSDEHSASPFQIERRQGESFEVGQTLKFAGNLPMRRVRNGMLPGTMSGLGLQACGAQAARLNDAGE